MKQNGSTFNGWMVEDSSVTASGKQRAPEVDHCKVVTCHRYQLELILSCSWSNARLAFLFVLGPFSVTIDLFADSTIRPGN